MGRQGSFFKRFTDILFSLIILIATFPIFIIVAVAIKLESPGPAFFIHDRAGLGGHNFKMFKFRGMIENALAVGPVLTQMNDPRLTRMGKFLRRTSIDELPNFINVLFGEMSIIGPRPEMPSLTNDYTPDERAIFQIKPGVTGISQVNGRQMLTPSQRVKMELEYYQNENLFSDIQIVLKTIKVVFTNEGNI
jgi:lipopolysaccharide/colanic/teichoic acid biosynthesis glycosyltransferase